MRLEETGRLARTCAALSDTTRWTVLERVGSRPLSASALARELPVSRQAIAKHLAVLEDVGLVSPERVGRETVYTALGQELSAVGDRLTRIGDGWERRLDRVRVLAESLERDHDET